MSISTENSRMDYTGNGATAVYSYTFLIFAAADLLVTVKNTSDVETVLVLNTDYSVDGVGDGPGGSITLTNASQAWLTSGFLTTGYTLTVRRVVDVTQPTDIANQGAYFLEDEEAALDRTTMIDQQQQVQIDQSLKLPETEAGTDAKTRIPTVAERLSKVLGFDSSGNPIAVANVPTSGAVVTTFAESLLDDLTAGAALTTLGVSAFIQTLLDDTTAALARATLGITPDLELGDVGIAGSLSIRPPSASKGITRFTAQDNSGNTTTNIRTLFQADARTYDIPDAGNNAQFVMTRGDQQINGVKTFADRILMAAGDVSSPSFSFVSYPATGWFASGTLGSEVMSASVFDTQVLDIGSDRILFRQPLKPNGAGTISIGDASDYINDLSYKTLTDRGCLPWCDEGVEMADGTIVSDLTSLLAIKKHPTDLTIHGLPKLDYSTFPKKSYRPADKKGKLLPRDANNQPIGGSDGVEMTMIFGVLIGAFKEVAARLSILEAKKNG